MDTAAEATVRGATDRFCESEEEDEDEDVAVRSKDLGHVGGRKAGNDVMVDIAWKECDGKRRKRRKREKKAKTEKEMEMNEIGFDMPKRDANGRSKWANELIGRVMRDCVLNT